MSVSSKWSEFATPAALGIAACAACCAVPFVGLAVGAGVASTVAAVAEPAAGVMLATSLLVGGVVWARRRREAGTCETTGSCSVDRSCGCAPALDEARAAGCTLDAGDLPGRGEAFRSLFARALAKRESSPTRAVWTFAWSPAVEEQARALAAAETGCCPFFEFDLTRRGGELVWTATVPPGREDALAMLERVAAEARPVPA